jgi:hypothetical protein
MGLRSQEKIEKYIQSSPWLVILNHECGYLIGGLTWSLSEFARSGDAPSSADLTQQVRREIGCFTELIRLASRLGIDDQSLL